MITVLLFASLKEAIGQSRITFAHAPVKVSELLDSLSEQYREANFKGVMVAVNEKYANPHDWVDSGNIVALMPPISGG